MRRRTVVVSAAGLSPSFMSIGVTSVPSLVLV